MREDLPYCTGCHQGDVITPFGAQEPTNPQPPGRKVGGLLCVGVRQMTFARTHPAGPQKTVTQRAINHAALRFSGFGVVKEKGKDSW